MLAEALVKLAALKEPPTRFAAEADAVQTFEVKANALLAQAQAHREPSSALAHDTGWVQCAACWTQNAKEENLVAGARNRRELQEWWSDA
jgi:hypothetical protein